MSIEKTNCKMFDIYNIGFLLEMTSEELQRFIPDLIEWHTKFRNAILNDGNSIEDYTDWGIRWYDDRIVNGDISDYLFEQICKPAGMSSDSFASAEPENE